MCSVGVKVLGCALFANDGKRKSQGGGYLSDQSRARLGVNFKRNQQSKDVELSATHLTLSER